MYAGVVAWGFVASMLPWNQYFMIIITVLCGYQLYEVKNQDIIMAIQKQVIYSTIRTDDNSPSGLCICKNWSVVFMNGTSNDSGRMEYSVTIVTTPATFKYLTELPPPPPDTSPKYIPVPKFEIKVWEPTGGYYSDSMAGRTISIPLLVPTPAQDDVITNIKTEFETKLNLTVLLYGTPGSGKTVTAFMLANKLKGSFTNTLNLTNPGVKLSPLYISASPSRDKPLVIVLEEVDVMLCKLHAGSIEPTSHAGAPKYLHDKPSWNKFLDELNMGMFPYIVLIMTTNKTPEFFDELDPSYTRKGRVHLKLKLSDTVPTS